MKEKIKGNKLKDFENKEIERIVERVVLAIGQTDKLTNKQIHKIIKDELKDDLIYKDLEDWQVRYSQKRIEKGVIDNKLLNQGHEPLSLSWFNFYVYFRLPAGIVVSFLFLFFGGLITFLSLIEIAIAGALFWGLKERKSWAYKMNFVVLIAETILRPLGSISSVMEFVIFVVIFSLIWLLPNWIYFKKRKYLFRGPRNKIK